MMTVLALCLHLAASPSHPLRACRDDKSSGLSGVASFVAADGSPGSLLGIGEEDERELERQNAASAAPLSVYYGRASKVLVMSKRPEPWLGSWLRGLSDVVACAASVRMLEAGLAQERANPGGVVDLRVLHDDGVMLAAEREHLAAAKASYRAFTGADFPVAALP